MRDGETLSKTLQALARDMVIPENALKVAIPDV